jgi:colanic acid/amylovoran biosynthesis glycosyltransferase
MHMRIAYLTNQYPHVRHTFIRREIVALEGLGVPVERFSVRDSGADAVDPADKAEYQKTTALLNRGKIGLCLGGLKTALSYPGKFLRAAREAWSMGRRSDRGVLRHFIYLLEACELKKELRARQVTHVHVHFATNPTVVALLCESMGGPPFSITIHGPEEWDRPEAISLTQKYERAAFVVAVSDFGRCQVYRWVGLAHWPKVHVVRCGVDAGFLQAGPEALPEGNQLVLVAGLVEQKGHLMLVQALEIVAKAGHEFQMIFVGDGPLRKVLEGEIESRGLKDRVTILGWQTNAQVREHLKASRALIMPSFAENLPVAMMEALATGRPVLGTYIAGVPELVEAGVNGWIVPAGNIELTAKAIMQVLETPRDRLEEMGRNGAAKVAAMHDAVREAGKLKALFERQHQA